MVMNNTEAQQLTRRDFGKVAVMAGAACLMGGVLAPRGAQAATDATLAALSGAQAEYEAAMAELQSITEQLEIAQYNLAECQANLQQTNDQIAELETTIAQKQSELLEAQDVLAERLGASYRAGTSNLLEVLLDSADFEDFVSRLYYANKVNDADTEAINNVKTLKAELEAEETELQQQRATQEQLLADQQDYTDQLASTESYYSSYTASLSSEVTALIAQAQQETIAEQRAAAERAAQEAAGSNGGTSSGNTGASNGNAGTTPDNSGSTDGGTTGGTTDNGSSAPDNSGSTDNSGGSSGGDWGGDSGNGGSSGGDWGGSTGGSGNHIYSVASIAWNYCGVPYVWGGTDPSGFDCSGLTQYCYAQAGYSIGRDTYSQAADISACGQMVYSMSQLEAGDLIFPHSGHVGIYQGGGCLIDAPYEGQVVQYRSCWFSDCFGGCPV